MTADTIKVRLLRPAHYGGHSLIGKTRRELSSLGYKQHLPHNTFNVVILVRVQLSATTITTLATTLACTTYEVSRTHGYFKFHYDKLPQRLSKESTQPTNTFIWYENTLLSALSLLPDTR